MNILTKICVVVLLVLILLACPTFINLAAYQANYRALHEQELLRGRLYTQLNRHAELANKQLRAQRDDLANQLSQSRQQNLKSDSSYRDGLEELKAAQLRIEGEKTRLTTIMGGQQQSLKAEIDRAKQLAGDLDKERTKTIKLAKDIRDLTDALADKEVAIDQLTQVNRRLREDVGEKDKQIEDYQAKLVAKGLDLVGAGPGVEGAVPAIGPAARELIRGMVTAVDDNVACINIGSSSGIRKGDKLIIHRENDFVAHLQVDEVHISSAVGVIVDQRQNIAPPKQGDKVRTR
ncbi:MAG TPA: hypothetical protein VMZ50_03445 [Phycisphaerae bacterium]|nr:hypothetical protein [Phycisphaerae bacterium]